MTIERPMFPPRADEHCQIIQFSAARLSAKRLDEINASACATVASVHEMPTEPIFVRHKRPLPEPLTDTCRNHRLRLGRRDAWWAASHLTAYWRARLDWESALSTAQTHGVAAANSYPKCEAGENRWALLDLWRTSLVKQMLTPAPDVAAVAWKRAQLRAEQYRYTDVKPERLQHAIDADVEWLAAHPSKKSIAASRQSSQRKKDV
jgi:hypothetical protein